jgi:N-acetylglucosaminyl-diphospho-decaprenol L-rhamnosyltransferase
MHLSIDVVVPVHGSWAVTQDCLERLRAQTTDHTVFVVDDASPDDTGERIRADYPEVTLITLAQNSGFAAACNAGIRNGTGDVVVLLNNDVLAEAEMLERLVAPFDTVARLGSAAPLLLQPNGRIDALGLCADPTLAGFVRFHGSEVEDINGESDSLIGPYGAVAAYRRAALDEVGLLDEGIFMYGEELDLALRLNAAGWQTTAVPDSRGVHLGGATAGRGSATQRERAGFGRGYLLRAYRVLGSRHGARAILTEFIVCAGDLVLSRDLASARGRARGWHAGRRAATRPSDIPGVNESIGFFRSLRLRVGDYRSR